MYRTHQNSTSHRHSHAVCAHTHTEKHTHRPAIFVRVKHEAMTAVRAVKLDVHNAALVSNVKATDEPSE